MGAPEVLMDGVVFGESPRWHDGRLWFSDWGANQVIALGTDGSHEVVVSVPSFPMCIDFLPDGRLLVVDSAQRRLLRREPDGSVVLHADLSGVSEKPWNDIVVDGWGYISGEQPWDLLVERAQAAAWVIMPVGCPICITAEGQRSHLPAGLHVDVALVATGEDLLRVIRSS